MALSATESTSSRNVLAGRSALVLGGGSGIGRAVVDAFADEGAQVTVLELSPQKCRLLSNDRPAVRVINGSACERSDMARAAAVCAEAAPKLDVLVNCVGIFDFYRGIRDIEPENLPGGFDDIFRVNVLSGIVATQVCLPLLKAAKGAVVLTASSSAFYPGRGGVLYVASKFAIRGCVAALAHELAPDVRVNGVAPGGVLGTDIRGSAELGLEALRMPADQSRVADLEMLTPLRLAMTAREIAASYVFLASEAARGMTGEFLHPDGGLGVRG
jgi:NAD(P)-dependent dehydrogenase (short-subunit alcohol dehydrogenase family)